MSDKPYKPGSKLARIHEVYVRDGREAASAFGAPLVAASTLKSWLSMWNSGRLRPKGSAEREEKKEKLRRPGPTTKPTVVVKWHPNRVAYLIEKGPEVSTIRWSDTREDRHYPNYVLEFGEEK